MASGLMQMRPFAACRFAKSAAVPYRTRIVSVNAVRIQHTSCKSENCLVPATAPSPNLPLALSIAVGALSLTTHYAIADDATVTNTITPEDLQILAGNSSGSGVEQILVSLLFSVVVALLVIVTGGVAFINIKQWLDNRQEKQDREIESKAPKATSSSKSAKASGDDDGNVVVPLKRASRIKKEKGKGFAEFTSRQ